MYGIVQWEKHRSQGDADKGISLNEVKWLRETVARYEMKRSHLPTASTNVDTDEQLPDWEQKLLDGMH